MSYMKSLKENKEDSAESHLRYLFVGAGELDQRAKVPCFVCKRPKLNSWQHTL